MLSMCACVRPWILVKVVCDACVSVCNRCMFFVHVRVCVCGERERERERERDWSREGLNKF